MDGADLITTRELSRFYKALSDDTRLRFLKALADQGEDGALCVGAIAQKLGISQSATSQHLSVLRSVGLVVDDRRGYFVHYRLNRANLGRWRERTRATLGDDLARDLVG